MQPRLTERLRLREWTDLDREPFAAMNADPDVTEFLPGVLSRAESDAFVDRIQDHFEANGFGLWAAEEISSGELTGFVGMSIPTFEACFMPCVEVGWRLARHHWGKGYATEAAREALRFGFEGLGLAEIVSFTVPMNERSRSVMRKLGMAHDPEEDFEHPKLPPGDRLRDHVLYRLSKDAWAARSLTQDCRETA